MRIAVDCRADSQDGEGVQAHGSESVLYDYLLNQQLWFHLLRHDGGQFGVSVLAQLGAPERNHRVQTEQLSAACGLGNGVLGAVACAIFGHTRPATSWIGVGEVLIEMASHVGEVHSLVLRRETVRCCRAFCSSFFSGSDRAVVLCTRAH